MLTDKLNETLNKHNFKMCVVDGEMPMGDGTYMAGMTTYRKQLNENVMLEVVVRKFTKGREYTGKKAKYEANTFNNFAGWNFNGFDDDIKTIEMIENLVEAYKG